MQTEILDENSEWVAGEPTEQGQKYRTVQDMGGRIIRTNHFYMMEEPEEPEEPVWTKISKYAFKQRFYESERIDIRAAAKVNPQIEDFEDLLNSATYVDLALPDGVASKLPHLETAGLLDAGRAEAIATAPVQEHEKWLG